MRNLIEWLNGNHRGKERVLRLLNAAVRLRRERDPRERHRLLMEEIFDGFQWYRRRLRLSVIIPTDDHSWTVNWEMSRNGGESAALNDFIELHRQKLEQRVRQCKCGCGVWFFARYQKHKFATKQCQQKSWRSSPIGRRKNAAHQRTWRKRNFG